MHKIGKRHYGLRRCGGLSASQGKFFKENCLRRMMDVLMEMDATLVGGI